jgi:Domain of unknown function (DUF1707)
MTTDRRMRASDQDRASAAELLSEAYAIGRLTRDELDERATAAYSAKTWGDLRDVIADLPAPAAGAGFPSGVMTAHSGPRKAGRRVVGQTAWTFALLLAFGLAGMVIPGAAWVTAITIPAALMLPFTLGISRHYSALAETRRRRRCR